MSPTSRPAPGPPEALAYDSARPRVSVIEEAVRIFRYRDLVAQLVRRDILVRCKRSALGVAWTMLNPLGMMIVLILAFSGLFGTARAVALYVLIGPAPSLARAGQPPRGG